MNDMSLHIEKFDVQAETRTLWSKWDVDPSDNRPIWTGHNWKYNKKYYRSLRILRTHSNYKIETRIAKIMAEEIRKEIDNDLLEEIKRIAKL